MMQPVEVYKFKTAVCLDCKKIQITIAKRSQPKSTYWVKAIQLCPHINKIMVNEEITDKKSIITEQCNECKKYQKITKQGDNISVSGWYD